MQTSYSERKGLTKYQLNYLTEEEIKEAIDDYKRRSDKVEARMTLGLEYHTIVNAQCQKIKWSYYYIYI